MVATAVLLLLHAPPASALASVVVVPGHALSVPVIAGGAELTVMVVAAEQPPADMKLTIEVPAVTPVTTPEAEPMVATAALLLVQVPPPPAVRVAVVPVQRQYTNIPIVS